MSGSWTGQSSGSSFNDEFTTHVVAEQPYDNVLVGVHSFCRLESCIMLDETCFCCGGKEAKELDTTSSTPVCQKPSCRNWLQMFAGYHGATVHRTLQPEAKLRMSSSQRALPVVAPSQRLTNSARLQPRRVIPCALLDHQKGPQNCICVV